MSLFEEMKRNPTKNEAYKDLLDIFGKKYCIKHRLNRLLDGPNVSLHRLNHILHKLLDNDKIDCMIFIINRYRNHIELDKTLVRRLIENNMLDLLKYIDEIYPKIIFEKFDNEGNTALHVAARDGYLDMIKYLLEQKGFDIEVRNYPLGTPLKEACERGHLDCVQYLISKGASINSKDYWNQTPLFYASCLAIVNILLDEGAEADICNTLNQTPLYWAAIDNRLDVINGLLEKQVRVDVADQETGSTVLSWVCRLGYLEIVRCLISAGADINHQDNNKQTPLIIAALFGHLDIVKELLNVKTRKVRVDASDLEGKTALSWACQFGHLEIVSRLIYKGADVNHQDVEKKTPLILSAASGHLEVVKELLSIGAHKYHKSKKVRLDTADQNGVTALSWACQKGHLDIVSNLISARADVNHQDDSKQTPLILAVSYDHLEVVKELLSIGVDKYLQSDKVQVDIPDRVGRTALSWACEFGYLEIVSCLLSSGADVNHLDNDKKTPLIISVWDGHLDVIEELLSVSIDNYFESAKVRVDVPDHDGRSALSWACQLGYLDMVCRLINNGADVNRPDHKKKTPLMWAASFGHLNVIQKLLSAGAYKSVTSDENKFAHDYALSKYPDCAEILKTS